MLIVLAVLFIVVPLVELYVIIQVGQSIGVGATVALLLIDSLLGAWLMRHQGRAAWVAFNRAIAESRVPAKEVLDGVLIIFGGALLLTPGFLTDILGLCLLIPPTRALIRSFLKWAGLSRLSWGPRAAVWGFGRVQSGRAGRRAQAGPGGSARAPGDPRSANGAPPGGRRARPDAGPFDWGNTGPRPGDIEGTAHEVGEEEPSLPPPERRPFEG